MWWNACVHRLDLGLCSHPKEFWRNGVRSLVDSKGKIHSTGYQRRTPNDASHRIASPTHCWLSYSGPHDSFKPSILFCGTGCCLSFSQCLSEWQFSCVVSWPLQRILWLAFSVDRNASFYYLLQGNQRNLHDCISSSAKSRLFQKHAWLYQGSQTPQECYFYMICCGLPPWPPTPPHITPTPFLYRSDLCVLFICQESLRLYVFSCC